jgi:hypothetical protein
MTFRHSLLLSVLALSACGRINYDPASLGVSDDGGLINPLAMLTAVPKVDGLEGEILISWQMLAETGADRLELRRTAGDSAPVDCADGELALSITDLGKLSEVDRIPDRWNRTHSYRACLYSGSGPALTDDSMVAESARYYNPEPNCSQPPCSNINSTVPTTGTFTQGSQTLAPTGASAGDILLSDINGDDNLDVVIATNGQNVVHQGLGDGTFAAASTLSARTENTVAIVSADFNNDGLKDIVFSNRTAPTQIHLNSGAGTFDTGTPISADVFPEIHDIAAADINGDTFLDLFIARFAEQDAIFLGDGNGGFSFLRFHKADLDNSCVNCLLFQDMNKDNIPDLVIGYNTGTDRVEVAIGVGDGTFKAPFSIPYGSLTPIAIKIADLNNDGNLDLVVGRSLGGAVYVSLGDGAGAFSDLVQLTTNTNSRVYGLGVTDFDGDGSVDIAFSQDNNGEVAFLGGNGDGSFAAQQQVAPGTFTTTSMGIGDINNDGKVDFVMGVDSGSSEYFLGN